MLNDNGIMNMLTNMSDTLVKSDNNTGETADVNTTELISNIIDGEKIVDLSNLNPGQLFEGIVEDIIGKDVKIHIGDNGVVNAVMNEAVNLNIGENVVFQVKENNNSNVVIKPFRYGMPDDKLVHKAISEAGLSVNDKNVSIVKELINQGQPLSKADIMNTLRNVNRYPGADIATVVTLEKHNISVNEGNIQMLDSYRKGEGDITLQMSDIRQAVDNLVDEIENRIRTYMPVNENDTNKSDVIAEQTNPSAVESKVTDAAISDKKTSQIENVVSEHDVQKNKMEISGNKVSEIKTELPDNKISEIKTELPDDKASEIKTESPYNKASEIKTESPYNRTFETKTETSDNISGHKEAMISDGKIVETKEALSDSRPVKNEFILADNKTEDNKAVKFDSNIQENESETVESVISEKKTLQPKETILSEMQERPLKSVRSDKEELNGLIRLKDDIKTIVNKKYFPDVKEYLLSDNPKKIIEEAYRKLQEGIEKLESIVKQAQEKEIVSEKSVQNITTATKQINQNLNFMNELNNMASYVQIPVKMNNKDNEAELFIYNKNKKKTVEDGINAFLHFELDNLGATDIKIRLKNKSLRIDFSLYDEESTDIVANHIEELTKKLEEKGYTINCGVKCEENTDKKNTIDNVLDNDSSKINIKRYSFDIRT